MKPEPFRLTVEIPNGHGTYYATPQAMERMKDRTKRELAKEIAQAYAGFRNPNKAHSTAAYWMQYPMAVLQVMAGDFLYCASVDHVSACIHGHKRDGIDFCRDCDRKVVAR